MKKNFSFSLPADFTEVKPSSTTYAPAIPMRDATLNAWQGPPGNDLLLQEFDGKYGYLYSYDTHLSDTLLIPLSISISDMHILYLMQSSGEVYLYTAAEELICSLAPQRARHLYLPVGDYKLEIPQGESHLFGLYYDGGMFRGVNDKPFYFIHDLIKLYKEKSDTAMSSEEFEVGKITRLHIDYLSQNLRQKQLDNEAFIVKSLTDLIYLSKVKHNLKYTDPNDKSHIAEHIRFAIQKQVEINGQDFNISELVDGMKYSQNYYNSLHKQYYDMTLHQYKINLIIEKAKTHLSLGHLPVKCAYECGFDSIDDFSRFFKKHTGLTPTQYIDKNT